MRNKHYMGWGLLTVGNRNVDHSAIRGQVVNITILNISYIRGLALFQRSYYLAFLAERDNHCWMSLTISPQELISRARAPYLHYHDRSARTTGHYSPDNQSVHAGVQTQTQNWFHSGIEPEPLEITDVGNRNVDHSAIRVYGRVINITILNTNHPKYS